MACIIFGLFHITVWWQDLKCSTTEDKDIRKCPVEAWDVLRRNIYVYFFYKYSRYSSVFTQLFAYSKYDLILIKVIMGNLGYYKVIIGINCCLHGTVLLEIWSWLGSYLNDV